MKSKLLQIGPRVTAVPIVHGSGDFAVELRRVMLNGDYDCLAVPLPASFQPLVEEAILQLPTPSIVVAGESPPPSPWTPESSESDRPPEMPDVTYVPIDPCQGVIAAIRAALGERMPIRFIDLESNLYRPHTRNLPDPYALKTMSLEKFAAAAVPFLKASPNRQWRLQIDHMACRLRELSVDFRRILFVCSILDWPWIRQSFLDPSVARPPGESPVEPEWLGIDPQSLYFLLGELPFVTELYERARSQLGDDSRLSIDGVKQLMLTARADYMDQYGKRARRISPKLLSLCLQYIRNLTLMDRRFTPQLITIATAAKQMAGDGFAVELLEAAKRYRLAEALPLPTAQLGLGQIRWPDGRVAVAHNRLPGPPIQWTRLELKPRPDKRQRDEWSYKWNPLSQCSWPPEDEVIENFRRSVFDRARELLGADLAKTEKFTTSIMDGIDMRETLRNWHAGELHVKVIPPNRGKLDAAVMLFDSPADPRDYPWRTTWFAEHANESTLAFFASDFRNEPVGPGICLATYGGAMFIFPPVSIPDIWQDPRLDFTETLEERILAAACLHSRCRHIALVCPGAPGLAWRRLAKHYGKAWIHIPLARFSEATVQQLRMVHVLNSKQVRSFAAQYIRRA